MMQGHVLGAIENHQKNLMTWTGWTIDVQNLESSVVRTQQGTLESFNWRCRDGSIKTFSEARTS